MPEARQHYAERMEKVLRHIDQHLDQPLDLNALAAVAHFSPYHFHRLFQAWRGERLGEYVRRRRLEVAAERLAASSSNSILEVALSVGFQSGEALSRAFKQQFGRSPSDWRSQRGVDSSPPSKLARMSNLDQVDGKFGQISTSHWRQTATQDNIRSTNMSRVQIQDLPATPIAYLRHVGPYGMAVAQFWRESVGPWLLANDLLQRPRYGIALDDPSLAPPQFCRYDAAVECAPEHPLQSGLRAQLPGGRYAVLPFHGRNPDLVQAWLDLLGNWLPDSGLELDERPCFEYYPVDFRFDPVTGIYDCSICIPVVETTSS